MTTTFNLLGRSDGSAFFGARLGGVRRDPGFERPDHAMEEDGPCVCGECLLREQDEAEHTLRERFEDGTYNDRSNEG